MKGYLSYRDGKTMTSVTWVAVSVYSALNSYKYPDILWGRLHCSHFKHRAEYLLYELYRAWPV